MLPPAAPSLRNARHHPGACRAKRFAWRASACILLLLSVCFGAACGTASYAQFYERYAGTCQVSAPPPSASAPPSAAITDAFVQALNAQEGKLRECYVDSLRYGETHGEIRLQVALSPDGRVDPVTLLQDTTTFPALACCVVAVMRELRVEPLRASAAVSFEYSLSFHTVRTTDALGLGIPWSRSAATRDGYVAELDESTVVIGGVLMYPLAPDRIHYYSDTERGGATAR